MNLNAWAAFVAAACAGALALTWLVLKHRLATHWSFAIGLLLAAADTALAGVLACSESAESAFLWQGRRMWLTALLPSVWLVYSLCYSRGNYHEFLARWRWVLVGAVLIPVSLAAGVRPHLVGDAIEPVWGPVERTSEWGARRSRRPSAEVVAGPDQRREELSAARGDAMARQVRHARSRRDSRRPDVRQQPGGVVLGNPTPGCRRVGHESARTLLLAFSFLRTGLSRGRRLSVAHLLYGAR